MSRSERATAAVARRVDNGAQLRITVAAAVATVLATASLWPIFTRNHWFVSSVIAIAVVAAVGAGGRALSWPRAVVLVLQTAALLLVLTILFAPQHAILGIVPTLETGGQLVDLMSRGARSINQQTVPVIDVQGIVLLVTIGIGVAAIEVDFTAVACRCPAISGIVLLAVYGVPATVLSGGAPWPWFVVAASGWLLLLYVARREAVHAWGTPLGEPSWLPGARPDDPRAALGRRIAAGAVASGVVLAAVVPGIGDGVLGQFGPGSGGGGGGGNAKTVRLSISATLETNLTNPSNTPLLTYRTSDRTPQYLRLAVLDQFDGVAWKPSALPVNAPSVYDGPQQVPNLDVAPDPSNLLSTSVQALDRARDLRYLPSPYTPVLVSDIRGAWSWDVRTSTVFSRQDELQGASYTVDSLVMSPTAVELAAHPRALDADPEDSKPPPALPQNVVATAVDVTKGATTDYAKAVRLQGWFRSNFKYNLQAKPVDDTTALNSFLTVREGYCQQFAATYALMARSLGIPTRVVVGFTPGTALGDGSYTVGTQDYHAWPEVWFDNVGWVRFEPTPRSGSGSNVDVPAWSQPGPLAPATIPEATASAQPTPSSTATSAPSRRAVDETAAESATSSWRDRARPFGTVGVVLLLAFLAAGPGLARERRRRRRLGLPPTGRGVEAAWAELADTARDLGLPWSDDDTPRRTADALVRDASLGGTTATSVQQLRRDLEQVRYAQRVQVEDSPGARVREVRSELMARSTAPARWRARLAPSTILRRTRKNGDR